MKSGFITVVGKPNAGKSTLVNALVGEKVAIVSWRPQTTRNKITGIMHGDGYQAIFLDTPGLHTAKNHLGDYMMKSVKSALNDVDAVCYVVHAEKGMDDYDADYIQKSVKSGIKTIVVVNKIDAVAPENVLAVLAGLTEIEGLYAVVPVSAKRGDAVDELRDVIVKMLPEGEEYYPDDVFTDRSVRFMAAEIIREKALKLLDKEIPYGIGVYVNKFETRPDGLVTDVDADIICEKQSHKAIIIGKKGEMLKRIATEARKDIEEMLDGKVYLTLWVRVKEEWRDSDFMLKELGYDSTDL